RGPPARSPWREPMDVRDAVASRFSCQAILPALVPLAVVREILDRAGRAPSGGNLQPWRVGALAGAPLATLKAMMRAREAELPRGARAMGAEPCAPAVMDTAAPDSSASSHTAAATRARPSAGGTPCGRASTLSPPIAALPRRIGRSVVQLHSYGSADVGCRRGM